MEPCFPILCHHCADESKKHISFLSDCLVFQRSEMSSWVTSSWPTCCSNMTKAVLKEVSLYPAGPRCFGSCPDSFRWVRLLGWISHLDGESSCMKALLHFYQLVTCISSLDLSPKLQTQIYNFILHLDVIQAPQTHHSIDGDANCPLLLVTELPRF